MATKNLKINVQKNNEAHKGFLCVSSCSLIFTFFAIFISLYNAMVYAVCRYVTQRGPHAKDTKPLVCLCQRDALL